MLSFGERRSFDLDDLKAAIFQLVFHRCGLFPIRDDGYAGFVGSSRCRYRIIKLIGKLLPRPV